MKKQILAYITALQNVYGATMNQTRDALGGLYDFVADLKEEDNDGEMIYVKRIVELNEENEQLKTRVSQLEEDVSDYQLQRTLNGVETFKLQTDNKMWQETCNMLKAKNEKLRGPHWVQD